MIMKMRVCEVERWKDDTIHPSTVPSLSSQEKSDRCDGLGVDPA